MREIERVHEGQNLKIRNGNYTVTDVFPFFVNVIPRNADEKTRKKCITLGELVQNHYEPSLPF